MDVRSGVDVRSGGDGQLLGRPQERAGTSRRRRLREAAKQEVIDCATAMLAESGPNGVTLREVARRIGVTAAALYRYVPSRAALLEGVARSARRDAWEAMRTAADAVPGDQPTAAMLAALRALRQWALDNPHRYQLLATATGQEPGWDPTAAGAAIPALVLRLSANGWQRGELAPPGTLPADLAAALATIAGSCEGAPPPTLVAAAAQLWSSVLGLLTAEVGAQLPEPLARLAGPWFERTVAQAMLAAGWRDPAAQPSRL